MDILDQIKHDLKVKKNGKKENVTMRQCPVLAAMHFCVFGILTGIKATLDGGVDG